MIISINREKQGVRFLVDSGAFTAWKSGKEISLDSYCKFLDNTRDISWRYFMLDKIGDPDGTIKNYEVMRQRGFKPIPVFTRGEDLSILKYYYQSSDLVGIGGLVGTQGSKGFVKGIMNEVGDRKVHWLGFAKSNFVSYYKPYSFDCSSWASGMMYARINLYLGSGRWKSFCKNDFALRPSNDIYKLIKDRYKIDPNLLGKASEWKNSGRGKYVIEDISYKSWTCYMSEVEKKLGSRFFMAVASDMQVRLTYEAYKFWKGNHV